MMLGPCTTRPACVCTCREDIFKEIDLLCGMNHPNVIFLKEYFEEGNKVLPDLGWTHLICGALPQRCMLAHARSHGSKC